MKLKTSFFSAPALLLALVLCQNPVGAQVQNENKKADLPTSINISSLNTDASGETQLKYTLDGHRYKVELNGSTITELYVDNKKVPEADFAKYEAGIRKILAQVEEDRKQAAIDRAEAEQHRQQATQKRVSVNELREQAQTDRQRAAAHRAQAEQDRQRANEERKQAARDREEASQHRQAAEKDRARAEVDRKKAEEDRKQMEALFDELVKDQLLPDRESLTSLELDETRLVVNGKEQPAAVHQRYKAKYLKSPHRRLQYRSSGGNRTMSLD